MSKYSKDDVKAVVYRAIEISNYSMTEFKLTIVWLIDEFLKKESFQKEFLCCVTNFLFKNIDRKDLSAAIFDTILNL